MAQSSSKSNSYVQSAAGIWTPVGYAATGLPMPVAISSPNAAAAGYTGWVTPYGTQRVSIEPTTMFLDEFDGVTGGIDTLKWTVTGTSTALVPSSGNVAIPPTANQTTASFNQRLTSVPAFQVPGSGYTVMQAHVLTEGSVANPVYRFWGYASDATSPVYQTAGVATSTAVLDAVGWELDSAGVLSAVIYSNGTNSYRATIPTALWATAQYHRYMIVRRESQVWWFVDSWETPVATRNITGQGPWTNTLPIKFGAYNSSTAPAAYSFAVNSVSVSDSTAQNHTISDPNYHFRRVQVTAANHMKVAPYSSAVANSTANMTTAATTVLAANTSRIGATIFSDTASASSVYVALGVTANTAAFTVLMAAGSYYEVPYGFTGAITGVCATGTATLRVNELT